MSGIKTLEGNFKSEQQKLMINLRITSNQIAAAHTKFMSRYDLSMAQFNILRILRGSKEPLTINTIKERMIEKSPNTTRLMDKLLEKALIKKFQCSEDRRQTYINISSVGLSLLDEIDKSGELYTLVKCNLTDAEAKTLNALLDKMRAEF
jgi:MarR family 2-MHQ and catechol resistance regulon transcriptional repressor